MMRLVRGLCSSREAARQGFALALADTLRRRTHISIKTTLSQLLRETETPRSLSGQEVRDQMFGRLFGFMAIVRSGRLGNKEDADVPSVVESMLQCVAKIGARKSWLSELCHELVIDIAAATASSASFQASVVPHVEKMLKETAAATLSELRPETIAVLVKVAHLAGEQGMSGAFFDCALFKVGVVDVVDLTPEHVAAMGDPTRGVRAISSGPFCVVSSFRSF